MTRRTHLLVVALLAVLLPGVMPGGASAVAEPTVPPIVGRVTSSLDGSAVAGATVLLDLVVPRSPTDVDIVPDVARTTTDDDGRYGITVEPGIYLVRVSDRRHRDGQYSGDPGYVVVAEGGQSPAADVVLERLAELVGVVRDPAGQPVPSATVSVWSRDEGGAWVRVGDPQRVAADGSFEFAGLPFVAHRLSAAADGFATSFPETEWVGVPGPTRADLTLAPTVEGLAGRVTSSGRPAGDVAVLVERLGADGTWTEHVRTVTGSDGTWGAGAPAGSYRVSFAGEGVRPEWYEDAATAAAARTVQVTAGGRTTIDADVVLTRSVIKGRITAEDGGGVAYGSIFAQDANNPTGNQRIANADRDGYYSLEGLAPGRYYVFHIVDPMTFRTIYYPGTSVREEATLVELDGLNTFVADIDQGAVPPPPPPPVSPPLSGKVTGPGGAVLEGVTVSVESRPVGWSEWTQPEEVFPDGAGVWRVGTLEGHEYRVSFTHPDFRTQWYRNASRAADATIVLPGTDGIDARLKPRSRWQRLLDRVLGWLRP